MVQLFRIHLFIFVVGAGWSKEELHPPPKGFKCEEEREVERIENDTRMSGKNLYCITCPIRGSYSTSKYKVTIYDGYTCT